MTKKTDKPEPPSNECGVAPDGEYQPNLIKENKKSQATPKPKTPHASSGSKTPQPPHEPEEQDSPPLKAAKLIAGLLLFFPFLIISIIMTIAAGPIGMLATSKLAGLFPKSALNLMGLYPPTPTNQHEQQKAALLPVAEKLPNQAATTAGNDSKIIPNPKTTATTPTPSPRPLNSQQKNSTEHLGNNIS